MVNYNQMVNEVLTTCHPHSPSNTKPSKTILEPPKQGTLYIMPPIIQEQKLSNEEIRQNDLGGYCKLA
jgi:hypothetical protein